MSMGKVFYTDNSLEGNTHIVLAKEKSKWGPCTWISLAALIVGVCVLVMVILIFLTLSGHNTEDSLHLEKAYEAESVISRHNDTVPPVFLLTAIKTGAPKVCILDTAFLVKNPLSEFFKSHIRSAQHFDIGRVTEPSVTSKYELVHPIRFQSYVRSLGIDSDCHVVLSDHGEDFRAGTTATYAWWLFKVFGHDRVSVLQGGLKTWKALNYDIETGHPEEPNFGNFEAKWNPAWIVSYSDVFRQIRNDQVQIVDVRSKPRFDGEIKAHLANFGGRIRDALHLPVSNLFEENSGALKSRSDIRQLLKDAGVTRDRPILVYGDSGLEASAVFFAMVQENFEAHLYNGGWIEWSHMAPEEWVDG